MTDTLNTVQIWGEPTTSERIGQILLSKLHLKIWISCA